MNYIQTENFKPGHFEHLSTLLNVQLERFTDVKEAAEEVVRQIRKQYKSFELRDIAVQRELEEEGLHYVSPKEFDTLEEELKYDKQIVNMMEYLETIFSENFIKIMTIHELEWFYEKFKQ